MDEFQHVLSQISDLQKEVADQLELDADEFWNGLTAEQRKQAFYAVVKKIHQGEIVDQGSYRHVLYDVFSFDQAMYSVGMECGFLELHNAIKK